MSQIVDEHKIGHTHEVQHWPKTSTGTGWAVCACGATARVHNGVLQAAWHTCARCTQPWGMAQ